MFHFNHLPPNSESEDVREQKDSQFKLGRLLRRRRLQKACEQVDRGNRFELHLHTSTTIWLKR